MKRNIAVIGCGHWGKNLVRNFAELGSLAAVCDPDDQLAQSYAEQYNVGNLSFSAIISDATIEGVVLAVPVPLHASMAIEVMNAGKHVYVEKPLAMSRIEAEAMIASATENGVQLMVGHLLQYHPVFMVVRGLAESGELGSLSYIYSNRLSFGKVRSEEDVIWSFAPHDISMILSLTGQQPEVVKTESSSILQPDIADTATVHMQFNSALKAHVSVSWLHPYKEQKLVVVGEDAMAVFDDTKPWREKLALYRHVVQTIDGVPSLEKSEVEYLEVPQSEPLRNECEHFLNVVSGNVTPLTDGNEGLSVLKVLSAASLSESKDEAVRLATPVNNIHEDALVHESSYVDENVSIGSGTKVWHFSHILSDCDIGEDCSLGQNVVVGPNVAVGNRVKIQNNVSVYEGVSLEDGVFCGPSCVFTNVNNPRSEIVRKDEYRKTVVRRGASIGANATIICGNDLGEYCFIAAGAVVTKEVPAYALMVGSPAKRIGWMSKAGGRLGEDLICPIDATAYRLLTPNKLEEIFE